MKSETLSSNFKDELMVEYIQLRFAERLDLYEHGKLNTWRLSSKPIKQVQTCNKQKGNYGEYKKSYETRKEAIHQAKLINRKRRVTLFEYKCGYCEGWHISKRH
jgi:hypothetical protein